MSRNTIAHASAHPGLDLKSVLNNDPTEQGFSVLDLGTDSPESVDYPDFGYALAAAVKDGRAERGVLICGSGMVSASPPTAPRKSVPH